MRTRYCTVCSTSFDADAEGVEGNIGILPVAFCPPCKAGIRDFAEQAWDLLSREDLINQLRECFARYPGDTETSLEDLIQELEDQQR